MTWYDMTWHKMKWNEMRGWNKTKQNKTVHNLFQSGAGSDRAQQSITIQNRILHKTAEDWLEQNRT